MPSELKGQQVCLRSRKLSWIAHAAIQDGRSKKFMDAFSRRNRDLENGGRFEFGYDEARVETNVAQLQVRSLACVGAR